MIDIEVKDGNLTGALKKLKKKFDAIGVVKELRDRQQFTKPSVTKREMMEKAERKQLIQQKDLYRGKKLKEIPKKFRSLYK